MIGRLSGRLVLVELPDVVIDVGGVGYELEVGSGFVSAAAVGDQVVAFVRTVVRPDALVLYGFASSQERQLFDSLLKIQGVGPALALNAISALGADGVWQAVADEDLARLKSISGVGDKTARRIVIELAVAARGFAGSRGGIAALSPQRDELRSALAALGFRSAEIEGVVPRMPEELDLSDAVRWALKELRR